MSSTITEVPLQEILADPTSSSESVADPSEATVTAAQAPTTTTSQTQNEVSRQRTHEFRLSTFLSDRIKKSSKKATDETISTRTRTWNICIAVTGVTLTAAGLVYGYEAYRLQRWTSIKDYLEYCKENLVSVTTNYH